MPNDTILYHDIDTGGEPEPEPTAFDLEEWHQWCEQNRVEHQACMTATDEYVEIAVEHIYNLGRVSGEIETLLRTR